MANELRIRIGASVDASVANAFSQVTKGAAQAAASVKRSFADVGATVARGMGAGGVSGGGNPYRKAASEATEAGGKIKAAAFNASKALGQMATGNKAQFAQLTADLKKLPTDIRIVASEASKAFAAIQRDQARAAMGLPTASSRAAASAAARADRAATRRSRFWFAAGGNLAIKKPHLETLDMDPVRGAARFGIGAASFMKSAALSLAHGIGVQTDLGQIMGKNAHEEALAQDISSAGYFPGQDGPAGVKVDRGQILAETRKTAIDTGTDRGEVLAGLRDFVGKTGDLQLGRDILGDMAKLSLATGSNLADMVNAAGEVANNLGDVQDKGKVVDAVMRQIAGQGKLGAVEIKDLATQMAKLAGNAGKFEGGAAKNMGVLGILAQEAKAHGGAANAAQATTSVARFVDGLTQGKTLSHLKAAHIDPFTDSSHTMLRDPRQIIKEMLSYSKGDIGKLRALMPGSIGMKPVEGLAQVYRAASGTDADKIRAVNDELDHMAGALLSEQEVTRASNAAMEATEHKVTSFNEQMGQVADQMATSLLPAMLALAPVFLGLASAGADWLAKILGIDPNVDKNARTARARADLTNAEQKQLENALGRAPLPGEAKLARNDLTGQWVGTGGSISKEGVEQLAKQSTDAGGDISAAETELRKYMAEHGHTDVVAPHDVKGPDGKFHTEMQVVGREFHGYSKDEQAEISKEQAHIEQLKDQQAEMVRVLTAIHEALVLGQVTFKTVPTPTPPVVPPPPIPAGSQ